jgi:hypothetical protein
MAFAAGWIVACTSGEGTQAPPCIDDSQCPLAYQCVMNYCIPDAAAETLGDAGDGDGDGDGDAGDGDGDGGDGDGDPDTGDGDGDTGDGDGDPCTPGTLGCSCDAGACAPNLICNEDYLCVSGSCGDDIIQNEEECEGDNLQGEDCVSLGFYSGELTCDPSTCLYDTSGCSDNTCDPILQDCDQGLACYFHLDENLFMCTPTTTDIPPGEPCGYINDCVGGTICISAGLLPNCVGAYCCSPFCQLGAGDLPCEELPGTTCVPFFEQGMEPPGYDHVGACQL